MNTTEQPLHTLIVKYHDKAFNYYFRKQGYLKDKVKFIELCELVRKGRYSQARSIIRENNCNRRLLSFIEQEVLNRRGSGGHTPSNEKIDSGDFYNYRIRKYSNHFAISKEFVPQEPRLVRNKRTQNFYRVQNVKGKLRTWKIKRDVRCVYEIETHEDLNNFYKSNKEDILKFAFFIHFNKIGKDPSCRKWKGPSATISSFISEFKYLYGKRKKFNFDNLKYIHLKENMLEELSSFLITRSRRQLLREVLNLEIKKGYTLKKTLRFEGVSTKKGLERFSGILRKKIFKMKMDKRLFEEKKEEVRAKHKKLMRSLKLYFRAKERKFERFKTNLIAICQRKHIKYMNEIEEKRLKIMANKRQILSDLGHKFGFQSLDQIPSKLRNLSRWTNSEFKELMEHPYSRELMNKYSVPRGYRDYLERIEINKRYEREREESKRAEEERVRLAVEEELRARRFGRYNKDNLPEVVMINYRYSVPVKLQEINIEKGKEFLGEYFDEILECAKMNDAEDWYLKDNVASFLFEHRRKKLPQAMLALMLIGHFNENP
jgi:hypothetical protein